MTDFIVFFSGVGIGGLFALTYVAPLIYHPVIDALKGAPRDDLEDKSS